MTPRLRRLPGLLLVALLLGLAAATPLAAGPTVATVTVGGDARAIEIQVTASEPLSYALGEEAEPFTLTLVLGGAAFGFPDERRTFAGGGLVELRAETLTRDGQRLARLALVFAREAPYFAKRDGARIRVHVELPAPDSAVTIGRPADASGAPPGSASQSPQFELSGAGRSGSRSPREARRADESGNDAEAEASPRGGAHVDPEAAAAPDPIPPPATPAQVRAIRPDSDRRTARLRIDLDGAARVKVSSLRSPDRVVLDLEDASFPDKERSITVGSGLLRRVRISQHSTTVVRVVCDLGGPASFRVEPAATGLIVHLGDGVR
jgi:hypothetical protein